jgi:hypothetical protein
LAFVFLKVFFKRALKTCYKRISTDHVSADPVMGARQEVCATHCTSWETKQIQQKEPLAFVFCKSFSSELERLAIKGLALTMSALIL